MCYQRGDGVEKNKAMAFELYLRAAEQGSAEAA
jgi:TPR repeat protein